jgi:hypothetical protein
MYPAQRYENHEVWDINPNQVLVIHNQGDCSGMCSLHNPSEHHMNDWPLWWRFDRHFMERTCPHGIGHPDPDEINYRLVHNLSDVSTHGCDGCCVEVAEL